ncbi:macrolide family glycosyltransferase [Streptomyces sp. NPDC005438]|uniref:macrolide family glycosyltransferase n=1 Tax=Streptomyces sp. NPDC005438 TaxID=3156880 RepID=UPI0033AE20DE
MVREPASAAHIAMFTVPAAGHIHPSLEIIRELVARGHRVSYTVTDDFVDAVRSVGAEPVRYETTFPRRGEDREYPTDDIEAVTLFLDEAIHVAPQLTAHYQHDRPDLVLYDIGGYVGLALSRWWELPAVQISPTYVAWDGIEEHLAGILERRRTEPAGIRYYQRFRAWLAQYGVEEDPDDFTGRPRRSVATIAPALQPFVEKVDTEVYTHVGPCLDVRPHQGGWSRPPEAEHLLVISLGSGYNNEPAFYRRCLEAFGAWEGWHVVLNTGAVDHAELGEIPDNFALHSWIPQLAMLRQADAFVTHAGMGGTMEAMSCGVPMVAVPQAVDQFDNAAAIERLGIGRHLPKEKADPRALREAVRAVVDDTEVAARCRQHREELRRAGGTTRAVEIIEGYLPVRS